MATPEFRAWPKTPRLFRSVVVTEKIDGTNGALHVTEDGDVYAQSRNRMLTKDADNFGFASWAWNNKGVLAETLGVGTHYGEWWGSGIQRGYDCEPGERYFSLFNAHKWGHLREASPLDSLSVVPVLWAGELDTAAIRRVATDLLFDGSSAKPGFMRPEGVCIYHSASNQIYKFPLDKPPAGPAPDWEERIGPRGASIPRPRTMKERVREMFWLIA